MILSRPDFSVLDYLFRNVVVWTLWFEPACLSLDLHNYQAWKRKKKICQGRLGVERYYCSKNRAVAGIKSHGQNLIIIYVAYFQHLAGNPYDLKPRVAGDLMQPITQYQQLTLRCLVEVRAIVVVLGQTILAALVQEQSQFLCVEETAVAISHMSL